jgi:hypothetical protein
MGKARQAVWDYIDTVAARLDWHKITSKVVAMLDRFSVLG